MQNPSATAHLGGGGHNSWNTAGLPNIYQTTQARSTSNPRAYPDPTGQDSRRDDGSGAQQMYDQGYGNYQQSGYGNVGYGGYGTNPVNYAASPSGSRRTSGQAPKTASTPPTSAPPPTNTSPMYAARGSTDMQHMTQSPYQPTSAPPNASHHMPSQPQTAHPYGGGYYNYYDQGHWQYQQGSVPRPGQQSTPTQPLDRYQTPQTSASTGYDHSSSPYNSWDQGRQSWQTPQSGGRQGSGSAPGYYPPAAQAPPQPYPWQPWQNYNYPPPAAAAAPQSNLPPTPASGNKKEKKSGRKSSIEDYHGLGKRSAEPVITDDHTDKSKSKKGKKEEVKPAAPAKSHLNPPRQAQSAWQLFFTDELNKAKEAAAQGNSPGGTPQHAKLNVAQIAKDAGLAYANLNDEQKAYYAQKVQESKEQYARELAVWQATLTPEDIRAENAFRAQQRKEGKSRKGNLKDPNAPKKPLSAYFLFLKDIRENDDLRMKVWGDETETTKQSVLAAERWRSLSDDEKRPFLSQAENDKQEYEALRKVYEDEAAARARGEDVPPRPVVVPDVAPVKVEPGKSHKKKSATETASVSETKEAATSSPAIATESKNEPDTSMDQSIDEFPGFPDLTDEMGLGGFHNVSEPTQNGGQDWSELHTIMGKDEGSSEAQPAEGLSEAPALETAEQQTGTQVVADPPSNTAASAAPIEEVREVATAAEGELAVPAELPQTTETTADPVAVPTEETSEMPAGGGDAAAPPPVVESSDPAPVTTPPVDTAAEADPTLDSDADKAFESAALVGEVAPEGVTEDAKPADSAEAIVDSEVPAADGV